MFPDAGWSFNGLKRLMEKVTAVYSFWVVVNHTMQRSTKLKISH